MIPDQLAFHAPEHAGILRSNHRAWTVAGLSVCVSLILSVACLMLSVRLASVNDIKLLALGSHGLSMRTEDIAHLVIGEFAMNRISTLGNVSSATAEETMGLIAEHMEPKLRYRFDLWREQELERIQKSDITVYTHDLRVMRVKQLGLVASSWEVIVRVSQVFMAGVSDPIRREVDVRMVVSQSFCESYGCLEIQDFNFPALFSDGGTIKDVLIDQAKPAHRLGR